MRLADSLDEIFFESIEKHTNYWIIKGKFCSSGANAEFILHGNIYKYDENDKPKKINIDREIFNKEDYMLISYEEFDEANLIIDIVMDNGFADLSRIYTTYSTKPENISENNWVDNNKIGDYLEIDDDYLLDFDED